MVADIGSVALSTNRRTCRRCRCQTLDCRFYSRPQARGAKDPTCRRLARLALAGLPRGGGDGDAIRLGILNIMREHGIREGHRPVGTLCTACTLHLVT